MAVEAPPMVYCHHDSFRGTRMGWQTVPRSFRAKLRWPNKSWLLLQESDWRKSSSRKHKHTRTEASLHLQTETNTKPMC